jgi:hypothetical protein
MVKLAALAECLCAQIATDGLPEPCFCGLVPGEAPAVEYVTNCSDDKCGMAWVRLSAVAPITGIGIPNITINNCNSVIGFDAEVGIMRCAPVGDQDGNPPSDEELLAAADLQIADMMAMYRAMACCEALEEFIIETYTPIGPDGVAVGGFWTLSAGL